MSRKSARSASKLHPDSYDIVRDDVEWHIINESDADCTDSDYGDGADEEVERYVRKRVGCRGVNSKQHDGRRLSESRAVDKDSTVESAEGGLEASDIEEDANCEQEAEQAPEFKVQKGEWASEEYKVLVDRSKQQIRSSTAKQYSLWEEAYKEYCRQKNFNPEELLQKDGIRQVAVFYELWCTGSWRPDGRAVSQISHDTAMGVHAALKKMLANMCVRNGMRPIDPKDDPGYLALYKQYTKGRGRKRKQTTSVQVTRENHMQACNTLTGQAGYAPQGAHCTDMRVPDQQVPVEQPDSQQQQEGFCSQQRHQQWQQQSLRLQQYGASQQGSSQCQQQQQHRPDNPRQERFEAQSSFSKQQAATLAMLQQLSLQEQKQLMEMQELRQMATTPETAALLAQAERLLQNTRCTIQLQEKLLKQLVELQGCAAPALMNYLEYRFDKLTRELCPSMPSAPDPLSRQATTAGGPDITTQRQQQHSASQQLEKQQQACSSKSKAAKDCKVPSDFVSLADFVKYYTVDKILYQPVGSKDSVLMSRKEVTDAHGQWSAVRQRASDINVMYSFIEDEACRLTREQGKHYSIDDTVKELTRALKIGQKPPTGMTIPMFRDKACRWNKARREAQKVAAAAAAAKQAVVPRGEDVGPEQ